MAGAKRGSKKQKAGELAGQADPRAPLDAGAFLAASRPVLKRLAEDLLARAGAPGVSRALEARWEEERKSRRTAEAFEGWKRQLVDQVAAAWLLGCVFVRTLEDRGLVSQARLAGPGAMDAQRSFFELLPSLSEREYLLTVFRELSRLPAARALFDARSPVWKLSPSAEAARALVGLFRLPSAEAPAFRFGQADTRFLGDLYQDLNEDVRARYALLQTPRFVEKFILDRTLDRAIDRFGLDDAQVIDPTCGSGHFLLGAFERLFERRMAKEPALDARAAAARALECVYGSDINPYAVAIARFRLTLAFLEAGGITKLTESTPMPPMHVVVADSLLYGGEQMKLAEAKGTDASRWEGDLFALEDEAAAKDVMVRKYAAVVGNPPYITVKDPALRERYREQYPRSAAGKYSVAAPFTERFFELARAGGSVGMITANSFMKREFGKKLIEEFLPRVNLDLVANTSGAYIPGHGTPTVLLFGTNEAPKGSDVLTVLASRGEPTTPEDPEKGHVWSSIAARWSEVGFENEYISVARVARDALKKHPWSLGGGGASELKELLEERAEKRLGDIAVVGVFGMTNADECMLMAAHQWARTPVEPEFVRPIAIGEEVRDWSHQTELRALYPYKWPATLLQSGEAPGLFRYLWPYRTVLGNRATFGGGTYFRDGLPWWKWHQVTADRVGGMTITFAEVATHNHFVLDRGGKVFNRTAPIIKLPETATEEDHLALLAYLNSSTACFWMKQVAYPKGTHSESRPEKGIPEENRYAFSGTGLAGLPLPPGEKLASLSELGKELAEAGEARANANPARVIRGWLETAHGPLVSAVQLGEQRDQHLQSRMVALQEDLDWQVYAVFGLVAGDGTRLSSGAHLDPARRPFCPGDSPADLNEHDRDVWSARRRSALAIPELRLIEDPVYKRKWWGARGVFATKVATYRERAVDAAREIVAELVEAKLQEASSPIQVWSAFSALPMTSVAAQLFALGEVASRGDFDRLCEREAAPFLAALRYSDVGLTKRALWERTWDLQRREDAGEDVGQIPVPPKYDVKDFRNANYFRLRGKLDVPKERFISYPGCESDEDGEPVYGWAGWNHLQQAQALAALYENRKRVEGWGKDRLTPMLAGILELLPWVKQWHNDPSDDFDGMRLGDYFESYLDGECRQLGLTHDDLRSWRPAEKSRTKRAARTSPPTPLPRGRGEKKPARTRASKASPSPLSREGEGVGGEVLTPSPLSREGEGVGGEVLTPSSLSREAEGAQDEVLTPRKPSRSRKTKASPSPLSREGEGVGGEVLEVQE